MTRATDAAIDLRDVLAPGAHVVAAGAGVVVPAPTASSHEQALGSPVDGNQSPLAEAARARKIELLDRLALGDLSGATIVDYGAGARGFAGALPKLRACRAAIAFGMSEHAARRSARASAAGREAYGDRWVQLVARGAGIDVRDGAADVVLADEVIEHIDHTDAWLDEVHRVLKPGGLLILTTPNADAALYRGRSERWCVSPEHVALMGYGELRRRLAPRFDLLAEHGFNTSFHATLDGDVGDPDLAAIWAGCFGDRPDLATGVVVLGRRRGDWVPPERHIEHVHHDDARIAYGGAWEPVALERDRTGRAGSAGATATLRFEGTEAIVQLWAHGSSGVAVVELDGIRDRIDLYSPRSGFRRLAVEGLADGPHELRVSVSGERRAEAQGDHVILHRVVTARAVPR